MHAVSTNQIVDILHFNDNVFKMTISSHVCRESLKLVWKFSVDVSLHAYFPQIKISDGFVSSSIVKSY